ncbi:MAG: CoA-transferase subunit beta [Moorellales bacterium]
MPTYTAGEMMAVAGARALADGEVVLVGLGLPQVAAYLAKRTHAPNLHILLEHGVIGPRPLHTGVGIADARLWYGASRLTGFVEVMGMVLQRGLVDVGFLGALEIDLYGNLNTTWAGGRHFTGSGGANDVASLARRVVIIMRHEKKKFAERVRYLTSPGYLSGGNSRGEVGLRGGGPVQVITDKAVLDFEPQTKRLRLKSVHPGVSPEEVIAHTGLELVLPSSIAITEEPTALELEIIRREADPDRAFTG